MSTSEATPSTSASAKAPLQQPQTLEELLERQWEQGSQFLMEQASHFDSKFLFSNHCDIIEAIKLLSEIDKWNHSNLTIVQVGSE